MRKHDVQDCLNDTYLRFILPKALGKRTIIRKMRFPNDQESILSQVLRIFLIFHLRSLPRIKYFIHQQLYFYRVFWHFIDSRIIGILRPLGNIAQSISLTVVKEGRFEWNLTTMKLQANCYTQHLLGVLFIYLLLVPRP